MFPSVGMRVGFEEAVMGAVRQETSRRPSVLVLLEGGP